MSKVILKEDNLTNIANSIRNKLNILTTYKPSEMSTAINNIPSKYSPEWVTFNATSSSTAQNNTVLDVSWLDTSNMTDMSYMFKNCYKLETLDISNFDFSKAPSHNYIFSNCGTQTTSRLTTVYVKDTTAQNWILNLSSSDRPSTWSTANVIVKTAS